MTNIEEMIRNENESFQRGWDMCKKALTDKFYIIEKEGAEERVEDKIYEITEGCISDYMNKLCKNKGLAFVEETITAEVTKEVSRAIISMMEGE